MDGAASDLRTGLPWQMVEIHEPVRLLIVCETTAEVMLGVLERNPMMMQMASRGGCSWRSSTRTRRRSRCSATVASSDYVPEAAHLPRAAGSIDWYRGWRDHLEFAEIGEK